MGAPPTPKSDELEIHLSNFGGYTVVERGKMEEVLKEQGFQQTGCVSEECAVEVGKMLGTKVIVVGSISKVGSTFSVIAKIVDVQTGEIKRTANYKYRGIIDDLLIVTGIDAVVLLLTSRLAGVGFDAQVSAALVAPPLLSFLFLLNLAYVLTLTRLSGQTLGKMLFGIRVVNNSGGMASTRQIIIRTFGWLISILLLGIGFLFLCFGKKSSTFQFSK